MLQNPNGVYAAMDGCSLNDPNTWTITTHNNSLYAPGGTVSVQCGTSMTLAAWQRATGRDAGSTVQDLPSVATMMQWGRNVLHWPQ